MKGEEAIVYLIDDDQAAREGMTDLLRSVGHKVHPFGSAQEFLDSARPDAPGCIVLDVRLPGPSGLELQRTLTKSNIHLPIIFVSGHGDIPMSVRALKAGAIEFLTKPVHEQQLLDAVQTGIERDRARREEAKVVAELRQRFESLTPREREIFTLIVAGHRNKFIAAEAGMSEMTVKVHRTHVMQKMRANSVIDLARMADQLGVPHQGRLASKPKD
ncbi:MAG TPA: response regulator transcription factor [Bradyrhizobium sp.]|nr:response regulator transcription factor [Bradyrhizobium sp.]